MRSAILLLAAGFLASCAGTQAPTISSDDQLYEKLRGKWEWVVKASDPRWGSDKDCTMQLEFSRGGHFWVHAGDMNLEGALIIARDASPNGLRKATFKTGKATGKEHCFGSGSGDEDVFFWMAEDRRHFLMCLEPNFTTCLGPWLPVH